MTKARPPVASPPRPPLPPLALARLPPEIARSSSLVNSNLISVSSRIDMLGENNQHLKKPDHNTEVNREHAW
jgi:hypothetical protein